MDILGIANHVQQQGELGRQQGTTQRLNRLAGQAYGAPDAQQRNGYLQQMVATDPKAGIDMQNTMQGQDDRQARQAANVAKSMLAAVESKNPAMIEGTWRAVRPFLQQLAPDREVPEAWSPELEAGLHQAVAAGGEAGAAGRVHSQRVGADGFVYNTMSDGTMVNTGIRADPRFQARNYGDRDVVFDPRTGTFREGGAPAPGDAQGAPGSPATIPTSNAPTQAVTSAGEVIDLRGVDDPGLRAQIAANPEYFNGLSAQAHDAPADAPQQPFMPQTVAQPPTYQAPRRGLSPAEQAAAQRAAVDDARADRIEQRQLRADQRDEQRFQRELTGELKPADRQKLAVQAQKSKRSLDGMRANVSQTVGLIDRILQRKGDFRGVTGVGASMRHIPGSPWANLGSDLDQLRTRSAFSTLQEMRANSPTGGALGAVSDRENAMLQQAAANLASSQSPDQLERNLREYRQVLLNSVSRLNQAYADDYGDKFGQPAPQPQPRAPQAPAAPGGFRILD